jgi:hypothetical protein
MHTKTLMFIYTRNIYSAALAMQRPSVSPLEREIIKYMNLAVNYVFLLECILKIMSYGFLKYLKNRWNQLDFFLVVTSLVDIVIDTANLEGEVRAGSCMCMRTY